MQLIHIYVCLFDTFDIKIWCICTYTFYFIEKLQGIFKQVVYNICDNVFLVDGEKYVRIQNKNKGNGH